MYCKHKCAIKVHKCHDHNIFLHDIWHRNFHIVASLVQSEHKSYEFDYSLQRLLLLPELSSIEITSANSSPTSELYSSNVNEGLIDNYDQYGLVSSNTVTAKILVSGLTASWTQVIIMCNYVHTYVLDTFLGQREISFKWY